MEMSKARDSTKPTCPCGYDGNGLEQHLLEDHRPEDFGLSPLVDDPDPYDEGGDEDE